MRPLESYISQPIRSLQTMLRVIGEDDATLPPVVPDGIYGQQTIQAVTAFQRKYALYPINSGGNDVFTFVFRGFSGDTLDLPEETSLQRAIKRVYLDGGYIYESGGIFPVSDADT